MAEAELEIIPVKINGKTYRTALYNGVQRFVPNGAVDYLVSFIIHSRTPESVAAYNGLADKVLDGEISLEDAIEFYTLCKGSLGHFEDSLSSLIDMNPSFFPGSYDELVKIENPLWEDENSAEESSSSSSEIPSPTITVELPAELVERAVATSKKVNELTQGENSNTDEFWAEVTNLESIHIDLIEAIHEQAEVQE